MSDSQTQALVILGGGQLARMLLQALDRIESRPPKVFLLAESDDSSAAKIVHRDIVGRKSSGSYSPFHLVIGNPRDPEALRLLRTNLDGFGIKRAILTFESEWVSPADLRAVFPEERFVFHPSLSALETFRNKVNQKRLLQELQIAQAPFKLWNAELSPLEPWIEECFAAFGGDCVFKWGLEGYDGKGTKILAKEKDFDRNLEAALQFCNDARARQLPLYCEKKMQFEKELAVAGVRTLDGSIQTYPLVITEQVNGICSEVRGPASLFGTPIELERNARAAFEKITSTIGYVGTLAIEFFWVDAKLVVNEIAPRVHNSAHHTLDSFNISQFEAHLRAILGASIPPLEPKHRAFAMRNAIGGDAFDRVSLRLKAFPQYYDYEKSPRAGRKMGHLNAVAESTESLARELEKTAWLRHENPSFP